MRSVLAAAALLLAVAPSHAGPKKLPLLNVTCGHVITESVRIANSLQDCPADGLVVGAPGITIDLGGHRIDGVDAGFGIDNGAGHANVTVRNGIVREFGIGVRIVNAAGNTLTGLRITGTNGDGINMAGATRTEIRGNAVHANSNGIFMSGGSNDNVIAQNDVSENVFGGFYVEQSARNLFLANTVSTNGGYAFEVFTASGNTFRSNVVAGNDSNGFMIDSGANDNVLRGNQVFGNEGNGFEIVQASTGNVLQKNVVEGNAGHGIVSDVTVLTLRGNRANRNGFDQGVADGAGLGIFVPAGVVQSGNKAVDNDDARECESSELSCHVAP